MTHELKERGLIAFLRDYLVRGEATQTPSLRKLLLGFGILPVRQCHAIDAAIHHPSLADYGIPPTPTSSSSPLPRSLSLESFDDVKSYHTLILFLKPSSSCEMPGTSLSSPVPGSLRAVGSRTFALPRDYMPNCRRRGSTILMTLNRCSIFITSRSIQRYSSE